MSTDYSQLESQLAALRAQLGEEVADSGVILDLHRQLYEDHAGPRARQWRPMYLAWSNVFCYGEKNYINFRNLSGVAALVGGNHTGKSSMVTTLLTILSCPERGMSDYLQRRAEPPPPGFEIKFALESEGRQFLFHLANQGKKTPALRFFSRQPGDKYWSEVHDKTRAELRQKITDIVGDPADLLAINVARQRGDFITERDPKGQFAALEKSLRLEQFKAISVAATKALGKVKRHRRELEANLPPKPESADAGTSHAAKISEARGLIEANRAKRAELQQELINCHSGLHPLDFGESDLEALAAGDAESESELRARREQLVLERAAVASRLKGAKPLTSVELTKLVARTRGSEPPREDILELQAQLKAQKQLEDPRFGENSQLNREKTRLAAEARNILGPEELTAARARVAELTVKRELVDRLIAEVGPGVGESVEAELCSLDEITEAARALAVARFFGGEAAEAAKLFNPECAKCAENQRRLNPSANLAQISWSLRQHRAEVGASLAELEKKIATAESVAVQHTAIQAEYRKRLANVKLVDQINLLNAHLKLRRHHDYQRDLATNEEFAAELADLDRRITNARRRAHLSELRHKLDQNRITQKKITKIQELVAIAEREAIDLKSTAARLTKEQGELRRYLEARAVFDEADRDYALRSAHLAALSRTISDIVGTGSAEVVARINGVLSAVSELRLESVFEDGNFVELQLAHKGRPAISCRCGSQFDQFITDFAFRLVTSPNFIIVDEGFGCLDPIHMRRLAQFMPQIHQSLVEGERFMVVISHADVILNCIPNRITIGSEGGISSICFGETMCFQTNSDARDLVKAMAQKSEPVPQLSEADAKLTEEELVDKYFSEERTHGGMRCVCGRVLKKRANSGNLIRHLKTARHLACVADCEKN
jgi:hypothetical protein